ncbi:Wadjet anti-phage system protein JetD domain-containing protein [Serpentinicella alkaliphila]|nr:Wadjet anti-phage system protein JetD domain-containing protein [Serpentinicella alkaliphila]QUH26437.1 DUF2399 domain-containing protein [Serpentinicella alkaliphila]
MNRIIKSFIARYENENKKRFDLNTLEMFIINQYKSESEYINKGGYRELHKQMMELVNQGCIKEIKSSSYNGLNPPLKVSWQIINKKEDSRWDKSKILKYSDLLDFSYYINNPSFQTDGEWEYIQNIYRFLKSSSKREIVSLEERCLELFYDEKFLINRKDTTKGKYGILSRLKLSYVDLRMRKYGEMFIYWNKGVNDIKRIIILENHSTFFAFKRVVEIHKEVLGFNPDALIYGEGKKIESSFSFLQEIANTSNVEILYFGDIDSEGFGIYARLKEKYPNIKMELFKTAYDKLITLCNRNYPLDGQQKNIKYFNLFIDEMKDYINEEQIKKIEFIWNNDYRIPQELLNYEYLLKAVKL